jgi:hypothetical protein
VNRDAARKNVLACLRLSAGDGDNIARRQSSIRSVKQAVMVNYDITNDGFPSSAIYRFYAICKNNL